jgi:hypothetical protein
MYETRIISKLSLRYPKALMDIVVQSQFPFFSSLEINLKSQNKAWKKSLEATIYRAMSNRGTVPSTVTSTINIGLAGPREKSQLFKLLLLRLFSFLSLSRRLSIPGKGSALAWPNYVATLRYVYTLHTGSANLPMLSISECDYALYTTSKSSHDAFNFRVRLPGRLSFTSCLFVACERRNRSCAPSKP